MHVYMLTCTVCVIYYTYNVCMNLCTCTVCNYCMYAISTVCMHSWCPDFRMHVCTVSMYTTNTSCIKSAHLPSMCTECLRCELHEKQQLLEAKEREVEVERANNQRRLLQLERAVDEKCKEAQSLKVCTVHYLRTCICCDVAMVLYVYTAYSLHC